jgi:hypothetical protein
MAPSDVGWINGFLGKRVLSLRSSLYREYGFDTKTLSKIERMILGALADGPRTRSELKSVLESKKLRTDGFRFAHMMYHLALTGKVCCGAPRAKQDTFILLNDWVGSGAQRSRDESLAGLATLYFRSHGPATMRDFAWWAGIPQRDAQHGICLMEDLLNTYRTDGTDTTVYYAFDSSVPSLPSVLLLAGFDEYLLGYADRTLILDTAHMREVVTVNGLFRPTIIVHGRVAGMWRRNITEDSVVVTAQLFGRLGKPERNAIAAEAERYAAFLGKNLQLQYE